jgi:hypothetical protein
LVANKLLGIQKILSQRMRVMPILTKPCTGKLSEKSKELLRANKNREEWNLYSCEICGQTVGVVPVNGDWVTERHWPTIIYAPRKPNPNRYSRYS